MFSGGLVGILQQNKIKFHAMKKLVPHFATYVIDVFFAVVDVGLFFIPVWKIMGVDLHLNM